MNIYLIILLIITFSGIFLGTTAFILQMCYQNKCCIYNKMNIEKQLQKLDKKDLIYIMKQLNINIPKNATKKQMINNILEPIKKEKYKMDEKSNREKCKDLAFKTIIGNKRQNLRLLAGTSLYGDMWTRDAFITSLGLFSHQKHLDVVKQVLKVQAKNLRKDGLVPLRIGRESYTTKFLFGIQSGKDNVPVYRDDKANSEPTDSNPQFIIMSWLYFKYTNDKEFINSISTSIKSCYKYLCENSKDNMLHGTYFHSWYDTFTFNGPDLFSNVLFVYCIKCYHKLSQKIPNINYKNICKFEYEEVKNTFKKHFWSGNFLKISPDIKVMETAGNSLAILFGILSKEEGMKFVNYLEKNKSQKSQIAPVVVPKMSVMHLYWPGLAVGMGGYHNDRLWIWPHCIYSKARQKLNLSDQLENLEASIVKHKNFYENVDDELNPIHHIFQNSEENFSESCGSYLFAISNHDIF